MGRVPKKQNNMREIKFIGKRVDNGEWVYGDLIHGVGGKAGKTFILPIVLNLAYLPGCHPLDGYEVIPETVGQFTGLTDKNGVEIYEGDIVNSKLTCEKYKVYYNESEVVFVGSPLTSGYETECWLNSALEVVGNIHNNPELLK